MRYLFVLTELPYPAHRNGVALINFQLIAHAPPGVQVDLLVSDIEDPELEKALRAVTPHLGAIIYVGRFDVRRFRIGNLISGAIAGRCVFELDAAVRYLRNHRNDYDAVYVAPMMSYVDPGRFDNGFLNAVDSFARLNDEAHKSSGRFIDLLKNRLYRSYELKMLRRVALTNFVSKGDLTYVQAASNSESLTCTPNGVDTEYFRPSSREREPHSILFTGNFSYAPNKDAAVYFVNKVLPQLIERRPQTRLYIVGPDPPKELVAVEGVTVTGFVDDIRDYYQTSAVFVCPLLSGAGIKNKILEAMACGIPIVTTRLGADGIEGITAGEHYMLADGPHEFVTHILELWDDTARAERMAEAALGVVVGRMTWAEVACRYYEHLVHVSRHAGACVL